MHHRVILALALAAPLAFVACKKKEAPKEPAPAPIAQKPAPAPTPAPAPAPAPMPKELGPTGVITEAEFKALHELKPGTGVPPKGLTVRIAGQSAYLTLPKNARAPLPGVVVVHEWWGLNDNTRLWADRLAAEGYAALAVDLYGGKVAATPDEAMKMMKALDHEAAKTILLAAHEFLAKDPSVRAKKRGVVGWCMGGRQALNLALAAPDLDAAVVYYGPPVTDSEKLKAIKAHLLGIFANKDSHITPAIVSDFEKGLAAAGVTYKILRYDAQHAFANPSQKVYDTKAAEAAYAEVRAFLAQRLK